MLHEKLVEVLTTPPDGAVAIVTRGQDEPHVVNTWNSYVRITADGRLLLPVGGMHQTEENIKHDNRIIITVANREVQGKMYKGTGFLVKGTAEFINQGVDFAMMQKIFPWLRAVLDITVVSAEQTL